MGWFTQVMAILNVIERIIPIAERFLPRGKGEDKSTIVKTSAEAVTKTILPEVSLEDPDLAPLVQAKIDADVALANALQAKAKAAGSTVAILDDRAQADAGTVSDPDR